MYSVNGYFDGLDENENGVLTGIELRRAVAKILSKASKIRDRKDYYDSVSNLASAEQVAQVMEKYDWDKSNSLSLEKFIDFAKCTFAEAVIERVRSRIQGHFSAFIDKVDENQKSMLEQTDALSILSSPEFEESISDLFYTLDVNENGELEGEELKKAIRKVLNKSSKLRDLENYYDSFTEITDDMVEQTLSFWDFDENGKLSRHEFTEYAKCLFAESIIQRESLGLARQASQEEASFKP